MGAQIYLEALSSGWRRVLTFFLLICVFFGSSVFSWAMFCMFLTFAYYLICSIYIIYHFIIVEVKVNYGSSPGAMGPRGGDRGWAKGQTVTVQTVTWHMQINF